MLFSDLSLWTMLHGIVLGGGAMTAADLTQFPRALILSGPDTAWLHAFAMEIKEHMPWIASMLATAVAFVAARHRATLLSDASLRTTAAAVLWLAAWAVLHYRWRGRQIDAARIDMWTLILTGLGVLATFPPLWRLL